MPDSAQGFHFRESSHDLASIEGKLRLNEDRLHFEYERYYRLRNFQTIFFLFYTAIGAFIHKLFAFFLNHSAENPLFIVLFWVFLSAFAFFLIFTVHMVWPKDISFIDTPRTFYQDYYEAYLEHDSRGTIELEEPGTEIPGLLKENFLEQLELAVETNKGINDKVNARNRWTLLIGIAALIFYLSSIVVMETVKDEGAESAHPTEKHTSNG
ncbi:MAG: hypothetical protein ABEH38_07310 [Flavobacteriales bacterium]